MIFLSVFLLCPQTTLFYEDFGSGVVPPANWIELNNSNSAGWESGTLIGNAAFHDDYSGFNDNRLVSPQIDTSAVTQLGLHFEQTVVFASWRDHHYIDVSLDNGVTFINVADDASPDGTSSLSVDISSFAGINGVNVAFHYTGDYASEWTIDEVIVSDSPTPPPPAILSTSINPANGHTYHLLESTTWTRAEAAALSLGGNLATVRSQSENDWIFQQFGYFAGQERDLWIGLNDVASEGNFVWTSGEPFTYGNWAVGQPDNNGGVESFVHIYGANSPYGPGLWNDMFDAASTGWSPGYYGVVEIGGGVPFMTITNLVAGQIANVSITNCTPNKPVYFVWSAAGGGPINTAFGVGYVSPPFHLIPLMSDAAGNAVLNQSVPAHVSGLQLWFHGADPGSLSMLNPLAMVVG